MKTNLEPQEYFQEALLNLKEGKTKEAEKMLRKLLKAFPTNDAVLNVLGVALLDKKPVESSHLLKQAVKSNPINIDAWINLSSALKRRGQLKEALETIQKAKDINPNRADIDYNSANIFLALGRYQDAENAFSAAIEKDPNMTVAHFNLGNLFYEKREIKKARAAFDKALEIDPNFVPALINVGNLTADDGLFAEAEPYYLRVLELDPDHPSAHSLLGRLNLDLDRAEKAKEILLEGIEKDIKDAKAYVLLGNIAKDDNEIELAESYYRDALKIDPRNEGAQRNLRRLLNHQIPSWHFVMLADDLRNDAYQQAIERVVTKDSTVLDIGTGSGLLSLMAARAGAKKIVACEMHNRLAETAKEIIAANGYSKKITVINKKSTALEIGTDLPQKADILVSEILDAGVIGEGVLPTVRHALQNLLADDAIIIPAKVKIFGQLIEIPMRSKVSPVRQISGFDLSAFDQYRIQSEYITVELESESHEKLSDIFPITAFNFYNLPAAVHDNDPISETLTIDIKQDGEVQAVAFWFDLTLHEDLMVSSRPGGELKHWGQALYCFEEPIKKMAGDQLKLDFIRSDQFIWFELNENK
ncbi:MAG: tetratricopeptide repeat protein [Saprospiraceae bacterium]